MKITQTKFMKVVDHETGKINLVHLGPLAVEAIPTEFHFKSNGSRDDKPSLTIVMNTPFIRNMIYAQMTLSTLNECLNAVGYRIEKV